MPILSMARRAASALAITVAATALPAQASPALCDAAAATAARESGVPLSLLRAVMLAETGRAMEGTRRPWPWAVQAGGAGNWDPTRAAALDRIAALRASGTTNIDIGCFQLNLRWHGDAFASVADMIDPEANARHAAGFLTELYRETGDWRSAAGAYHSRDPARAERYVARLVTLHAERVAAETGGMPEPTAAPRRPARGNPASGALRGPILIARAATGPLIGGLE